MNKTRMFFDPALLEATANMVLQEAANRRETAAHNGSFGDGGATDLENQVRAWNAGRQGKIPSTWIPYYEHVEKSASIEAKERAELKRLFDKYGAPK